MHSGTCDSFHNPLMADHCLDFFFFNIRRPSEYQSMQTYAISRCIQPGLYSCSAEHSDAHLLQHHRVVFRWQRLCMNTYYTVCSTASEILISSERNTYWSLICID